MTESRPLKPRRPYPRRPPRPSDAPTSRTARRGAANPTFRRHWKVERFPPEIRDLIFDGYATGKSYRQIREEVLERGHHITEHALCNYWRHVWATEHNQLYRARTQAEILARQATGSGSPNFTAIARELLWLNFVQRHEELGQADLMTLLQAAREQEKVRIAAHKAGLKDAPPQTMSTAERRRRLREIYGWPQEEIQAYEQRHSDAKEDEPQPDPNETDSPDPDGDPEPK